MRTSKISQGKRTRKYTQKSRYEFEKKYRALIESSLDAVYVIDRRSRKILDVNDAVCKLLGYTKDEIIGTIAGSRVVPSQKNAFKRKFAEFRKSGKFSGEIDLRRKDGGIVSVEANGSAFGNYLFVIARDIAERKRMEEELRDSREFMKNVLECSADAIVTTNLDGVITSWSKGAERMYGYRAEDMIGKDVYGLYPASLKGERAKWLKELLEGERVKDVRTRIYRADGSLADISLSLALLRNSKATPIGTVGVSKDITDLDRAEEALRESEKKYRNLVDNALVGVYKTNLRGDILYVNDALVRMFEFESPEEFMAGGVIARYRTPRDRAVLIENLKKMGRVESFETEVVTKTGKTKNIILSATLEEDIISGMMIDIAERKRAEEALRESEETYRSLFQHANDGIVTIDIDGNYRYPNPKFCEITGYTREEIDGKHFSEMIHPDDVPIVEKNREDRIKRKRIVESYEYRIIRKDGEIRYVETRPWVIKRKNEVVGIQTIIRDITEKRKQEREISALLDISQNISTALDLDRLLDVAVKKTVEATGVDRVSVVLLDEQGKARVPAAYTKSGEKTGVGNVFDLANFRGMKEAVEKKKAIYVPNALNSRTQSPTEIALAEKLNIGFGVHVPLIARGRVLGLLNLAATGQARKFTKREIELYKAIANQLSAMIANAELYEETKRARSEAEFYVDLLSHDINNANTIALGMLELLAEDADLGDHKDYVQKSTAAIKRGANLIDTVRKIQLAKSTGLGAFERRNLDAILQEVIEDVKNFHYEKPVRINYAQKEAMVFTDGLVRDLFWNILDNAAKYDPHHDIEIDVEVTDGGSEWTTMISDRGKGIPDDSKNVIFGRFRRLDTGVRGYGVGLYLCKLLTDKYGGRIWVEDRVKGDHAKGSTFCISLPKA